MTLDGWCLQKCRHRTMAQYPSNYHPNRKLDHVPAINNRHPHRFDRIIWVGGNAVAMNNRMKESRSQDEANRDQLDVIVLFRASFYSVSPSLHYRTLCTWRPTLSYLVTHFIRGLGKFISTTRTQRGTP